MAVTTQKEFPDLIRSKTSFTGNSVRAETTHEGEYELFSYDTLIARWDVNRDLVFFNEAVYSSTTSKIQNLIRHIEG